MNKPSKIILAVLLIIWIWSCSNISLWKNGKVIEGDVLSYYVYLPALFLKHDIKLSFLEHDKTSGFNAFWYSTSETGVRFSKMGIGMAILYSPFFFMSHVYAHAFNFQTDGFSAPYHMFLCFGGIVYAFLGVFFLRKALLRFFSDTVTAITLLCIVLATNLLCYTTLSPAMSHAYSFFLFSLFLFLTLKWYEKTTAVTSILLGITCALIIVTRPTNGLIFIVFLLFGIVNSKDIRSKIIFFATNAKYLLLIVLSAFLVFIPQMLYWKTVSGHWVFYSYTDEHFFFNHPHITEGLFGYRKGWLLYTPIMTFAIIGIIFIRKKIPQLFLPLIVFLPLNIYVILSWWCWWYGGGFGGRPFIESYALMAFPLAAFFEYFSEKKIWARVSVSVVTFFFIALNCFQTYQHKSSLLHWDSMTKEAYWAIFGKLKFPENYSQLIKTPDHFNAKKYGMENPEHKN
jgi:hypothetical protein